MAKTIDDLISKIDELIAKMGTHGNAGNYIATMGRFSEERKTLSQTDDELMETIKELIPGHGKKVRKKRRAEFLKRRALRYAILSNGKSEDIVQRASVLNAFGKSLHGHFGNDSKFGKIGKSIEGFSYKLISASGALGVALNAVNKFGNAISGITKTVTQIYDIGTKKLEIQNRAKLEYLNLGGQLAQAQITASGTIFQSEQQNAKQLATESFGIKTNREATAHQIAAQSIFDIKGGAFAAAEAAINQSTDMYKFFKHEGFGRQMVESQKKIAETQLEAAEAQNAAQKNVVSVRTGREMLAANMEYGKIGIGVLSSGLSAAGLGGTGASLDALYGLANASVQRGTVMANFFADWVKTGTDIFTNLKTGVTQTTEQMVQSAIDYNKSIADAGAEAAKQMKMAWLKMTETVFDTFQKNENAAYEAGRSMGLGGNQLRDYAIGLANTQVIVSEWGKTMEDIAKMQMSYMENTGRNRILGNTDINKSLAFGKLVGDDVVMQLNEGMEIFNTSVSDSIDNFYEMYKQVSKVGLNGKKFTKDIANNLKIAEKYTFRNGVQGLMEMSKWAQQARFNTQSIEGMIEKVQSGGMEGVIKQAAELQVLGGRFAMGADPLAMAWESYNDPGAYAKRMNSMLSGLGKMDRNGNVNFNDVAQQLMRQMAASTGQNIGDVRRQAIQHVKMGEIRKSVDTSRFNEDQMSMIANKAEYKNGEWVVNLGNNNIKNVNELTEKDINGMAPSYDNKPVEDNVANMRSSVEKIEAAQTQIAASLQLSNMTKMMESSENIRKKVIENFQEKEGEYNKQVENNLDLLGVSLGDYLNAYKESTEEVDSQWKTVAQAIEGITKTFSTDFGEVAKKFNTYDNGVKTAMENYTKKANEILGILQQAFPDASSFDETLIQTYAENFTKNSRNGSWLQKAYMTDTVEHEQLRYLYEHFDEAFQYLKTDYDKKLLSSYRERYLINNGTGGLFTKAIVKRSQKNYIDNIALIGRDKNDFEKNSKYITYGWPGNGSFAEGESIIEDVNDGLILQNGKLTRIDSSDQVLAAKSDGPLDKMLDMVRPVPKAYDSFVQENPFAMGGGSGKIEVAPIQININGSIQVSGSGGSIDITRQIASDPNFIRSLTQMISAEVEKRANGGKVKNVLNNI